MLKQKYSINELVEFAVEIEKHGNLFYTAQATRTKNLEAKKLFELLADQENQHRQKYARLLEQVDHSANIGSTYSDDYSNYLQAIVENVVFTKDEPMITNDADVIEYAIGKEKDSILFYREMIGMVAAQYADTIQSIIEEEQYHIVQLLNMKEVIG
jgi:rubrerythrin